MQKGFILPLVLAIVALVSIFVLFRTPLRHKFSSLVTQKPITVPPTVSSSPKPITVEHPCRIGSHAMIYGAADAHNAAYLDAAASSGACIARLEILWPSIQPRKGTFDWSLTDQKMALATARHLDILGLFDGSARWNLNCRPGASSGTCPPRNYDDWKTFVSEAATHYKGIIHYYEIRNEVDANFFWTGTPADYAHLYSVAYDAIKAVDPTAKVLNAGLAGSKNPDDTRTWLKQVLSDPSYPIRNKIDIANVHLRGTTDEVIQSLIQYRSGFTSQGITGDLWITEFGYPADPAFQKDPQYQSGAQSQADYYAAVLPRLLESGAARVFITLHDDGQPGSPFNSEGLVTFQAQPRPALSTVHTFVTTQLGK